MNKAHNVPSEIADFYYWMCENVSVVEANHFLDHYIKFKGTQP